MSLGLGGALAGLLLAAGLVFRRPGFVAWALAVVGAEFAGLLELQSVPWSAAAAYAGGLVLLAELSYLALDAYPTVSRLPAIAMTAVAAGAGAVLLFALSGASLARGNAVVALGVLAAVLTLGTIAHLARKE